MTERRVILFMFAGRRGNLQVNLPMIRRMLDEHPEVHFHVWDLARTTADSEYLKTISGERITVMRQYAGPRAPRYMNHVWTHYCNNAYRNDLFVKIDDDVVFIQTDLFGDFLTAVENNPDRILTAEVVNNGACTQFMPQLWNDFLGLDIPLLDVHESNEYAQLAHRFLLDNWRELTARPTGFADIESWLSINFIGLHWEMLTRMESRIGRRSPEWIADRQWKPGHRVGDEGAANMFDRTVMTGFTVGHLGFGPQKLTVDQESWLRSRYAEIGQEYLAGGQKLTPLKGKA